MDSQNQNTKFKALIGVLAVILVGLTIYTVNLYTDYEESTTNLEIEKQKIEEELEVLIANYEEALQEGEIKEQDLVAAKERIEKLLDSVKDMEHNIALIRRYRVEVGKLKAEKDMLFKKVDSLQIVTTRLENERDSTYIALSEREKYVDSIALQNQALAEMVVKGATLKLSNVKSEGIFKRRSGKVVTHDKSRRVEEVRTCFTINENELTEAGDKLLFVQVINPKNNVIGEKATVNFEENTLTYSASTNVFYENKALDVCIMIPANEEDIVEGMYTIHVFEGARLLATSQLELR